jgi:predicted metal-dependent peptidase
MPDKKARDSIIRARTQLIVREPFFGTLCLQLNLVESPVGTMAVDGINLYYDPKFVHECNEEELVGVIAHETLHCCYSHFSRRGHRDPTKFNIAGDFRINDDLKHVPFTLPYKPATLKELMSMPPGQHFHLYDPQFASMNTEEIYEKIPDPPKQPSGGGGAGKVIDVGGCGAVLDAGSGPGDPDGDPQGNGGQGKLSPAQVAHEWQANVRMAVSVARANNAGQTPGYLSRLEVQLKKPKVSWRDLTAQFIDQSMTVDYSYRRPNRRYAGLGMIMPGVIPDALHKLVAFVDDSGSISHEMMNAFLSEVAGALDQGTCDNLIVAYADTQVHHVDEYVQGDVIKCNARDGGVTDFDNSFEWLAKEHPDAACVVYLTDMCTNSFGKDPGCPVLWGAFTTEDMLRQYVPSFGQVLHIESPHY